MSVDRQRSLAALAAVVLGFTGCTSDGLSVPYDQIHVACDTNADCPREAPLCHLHRFRDASVDGAIIEVRQCTRRCTAGVDRCVGYEIHLFEGQPAPVLSASCAGVDENDIYDFSTAGGDFVYPEGYCFDIGIQASVQSLLEDMGLYYPDCPTLGTEPRLIVGNDRGTPHDVCIPPADESAP